MRTRTGKFIAATVIVGALVGGCGTGPSRVDAAAVIGPDTITLSDAQSQISTLLSQPALNDILRVSGDSEAEIGRVVVDQLVVHDLLARAAAEQNIVVRDDEVVAAVRSGQVPIGRQLQPGGAGEYVRQFLPNYVRDQIVAARLAERQIDRLAVTVDTAIAPDRAQAQQIARQLAAGGAQAERVLSDTSIAQRGLTIRPSSSSEAAVTPLIGIPAGSVALFQLSPERGWGVARVTERRTDAPPVGPPVAGRFDQRTLAKAGVWLLGPAAAREGVTVNPRFGTWDPALLVLAPDTARTGEIIPATSAG